MTLTDKQLHTTLSSLKDTLLKRCLPSIPKEQLALKRKKIFDLVTECLEERKNIFISAIEEFANHLDRQELSASQYNQATEHFCDIPAIEAYLAQLQENIILLSREPDKSTLPAISSSSDALDDSPRLTPTEGLMGSLSLDSLHVSIGEWIDERYSPVDERVLSNNERRQRRMDSLARLLSLRTSLSACTAVTLDVSSVPRMVVGANVGKNDDQDTIFTEIAAKLNIIQHYLAETPKKGASSIESIPLDHLAEVLVSQLLAHTNTSTPPDVLLQAARKIIDAVCFDDETFTDVEKSAFLPQAPVVIILPKVTPTGYAFMHVRELNVDPCIDGDFPLSMVLRGASVKYIHAEQLVAHYLFEELELKTKSPLAMGISKLCCLTCFEHLSHYPVTLRGHHNQVYQGVVNLHNGEQPTEFSARRAVTHAKPSPGDTPDKRLKLKRGSEEETSPGDPRPEAKHGRLIFAMNPLIAAGDEKKIPTPSRGACATGFFDHSRTHFNTMKIVDSGTEEGEENTASSTISC